MADSEVVSTNQLLEPAPWKTQGGETPATQSGEAVWKRGGKKKEDLLKKYRTAQKTSKKWRDDEKYDATWKRLIDLYRNKHFTAISDSDRIAVNIAFATINVIVPSVAVNYPTITINSRQETATQSAIAAEAMVNYWWKRFDWQPEIKRTIKDALIIGHGWAKIGWRYEQSMEAIPPEERDQLAQQQIEEAGNFAEQNPEQAHELPTDEDIVDNLPTHRPATTQDQPFVERVSPFDVFVDPEATCYEDIRWIAQKMVVPFEEVKKDKRYNQRARNSLQADAGTNPRWRDKDSSSEQAYTDEIKRVTIYEHYDVKANYFCVFAETGDDFLLDPSEMPYPYGIPFVPVIDYDVPDQFYGIGELEAIEPLQHELNAVRSDMMNHRKRDRRKYLYKLGKFDDTAIGVLESDADNALVPIDSDEPLEGIIVPVPQTPMNQQVYQYSEQIESDIDLVSGVSEYQRGSTPETRRTATEASIIQDASNARSADKLATIERFIREIAERVVMLAQTHLTGEHVARIVGPDAAAQWVPFDRESISGSFDFDVESGSTQPKNETFRRQQAVQLANMMMPFVDMGVVNPQALATHILKDGFGIKNPEQFVQDPMMAMQQQQMQMMGQQPPPEEEPPPTEGEAAAAPEPGPNMDPQLLTQAQLQGQVGLNLLNIGGSAG